MSTQTFDVVVIGAGLAGLAATIDLTRAGRSVALLEARDRIGGRIHTLHDPTWPCPVECGAEFVHGRPAEVLRLLKAGSVSAYDVTDTHWAVNAGGRLTQQKNFWEKVEKVFEKIDRHRGADHSFEWFMQHRIRASAQTRALINAYIEGFDAADPARVGIHWLRNANRAEEKLGSGLFRVAEGYDQVLEAMMHQIGADACIRLNTIVEQVDWARGHLSVRSAEQDFRAAKTIVTLPLGVLQAPPGQLGAITFSPALPKTRALKRIHMGAVLKVFLRFDEAFWEEAIDPTVSFMHAPDEPLLTWWTSLPYRSPVLTGWSGGPRAQRLSIEPPEIIVDRSLETLSRMLRMPRARLDKSLRAWRVANWQADPFSRGAYSYGGVHGARAAAELARPVDQILFFAGEATQPGMNGTVASALASGYRAAKEVLDSW